MKNNIILIIPVIVIIVGALVYIEYTRPIHTANGNAPELSGISYYINAPANNPNITIASLKGRVVLVDFWTYSCVNCIRTLPHLKAWYAKYASAGFIIIGVHTPEFDFEKNYDNVNAAVKMFNITYPVVMDNNYATWNAFGNNYWPHEYLIDMNGNVRYDTIGEGDYANTESHIQELLLELGKGNSGYVNITDQTPTTYNTPELYLGYEFATGRGQALGNDGGTRAELAYNYTLPKTLNNDIVYAEGEWYGAKDSVIARGNSSLYLKFSAKNANMVASSNQTQKVIVYIDDNYLTKDNAGTDINFDGNISYIIVDQPRLYDIYNGLYGVSTLKLSASDGFSINTFTFG